MVYGAAFASYASQLPNNSISTTLDSPVVASSTASLNSNFGNYSSMNTGLMPIAMLSNSFQSSGMGMPPRKNRSES